MTTTATVEQARAQLKQAETAAMAEQRRVDQRALQAVRDQLRTAHARYRRLVSAIRREETQLALLQADVEGFNIQIRESLARRPAVADVLPNDWEVVAWQRQHDRLTALRGGAIQRRDVFQQRMTPRIEAAQFEGTEGAIAQLEYAEANLIRKLRGEALGWKGGIETVA